MSLGYRLHQRALSLKGVRDFRSRSLPPVDARPEDLQVRLTHFDCKSSQKPLPRFGIVLPISVQQVDIDGRFDRFGR